MEQILSFGAGIFQDGLLLFAIRSVILYALGEFLVRMIQRSMRREGEKRGESARTPIRFIGNVVITLLRGLVIFLILSDIKPLSGIGRAVLGATSLIAVIVSLSAQEAFGNLIAGFFLAMYQPFRLGDPIILASENIMGTVEEITLRHTVIRTYDGTSVIIPNSKMNSATIENRRTEKGLFSRQIVVSVAYDSDIDLVRKVIIDAVSALDTFIDPRSEQEKAEGQPPVKVVVTEFLDSGIEVRFRVFTKKAGDHYFYDGLVRETVLRAFRENHIEIPYPTRTVELKK